MYAIDFEYDNRKLSDYGFIICDFDSSTGANVANAGSKITFNTVSRHNGKKSSLVNTQYNECLQTTFDICKNPDLNDEMKISNDELRNIIRWLNRKEFLKFQIINDDEIGGRNLLPNTKTMSGYTKNQTMTMEDDAEGYTVASWPSVDELAWRGLTVLPPLPYSAVKGKTVTVSFDAKTTDPDSYNAATDQGLVVTFNLCPADSTTRQLYSAVRLFTTELSDSWQRISITRTLEDNYFSSGEGTIDDDTRCYIMIYDYSVHPMDVRKIKMEFGNKATDWTPAPEDDICFYNASFNIEKITISEILYGLRLTMETDSPFGYGAEQVFSEEISTAQKIYQLTDVSDEIGYTYPSVKITCKKDGDLYLYNTTFDNTTLIKNCSVGETITIDGDTQIITTSLNSHHINKDFNFQFFKIGNHFGNRINDIKVSIPCTLEIRYNPIIKGFI